MLTIVVLYNSAVRHLDKCPSCLQGIGSHVAMKRTVVDYWGTEV